MKVLIIEDEYNLADAISSMLLTDKYVVKINVDGEEGLYDALTDTYDLIILDVMLPNKNGFEILKELRKEKVHSKIIMLTVKNTIDDKMLGFNNGADDYLTKPFHMNELLARVNLQLRKNDNGLDGSILEIGDLKLDIKNLNLICLTTNYKVSIIGKEFQLLETLMRNTNQIMSGFTLLHELQGYLIKFGDMIAIVK